LTDVITVEFGKEDREHVRRFSRLMGIVEAHEADVLADPIKHLRMAAEYIALMRRQIEDAKDAERSAHTVKLITGDEPIKPSGLEEVVRVPTRDWEALQEMRKIAFSDDYKAKP